MTNQNWIFWQNFPNHLQSALIRALAEQPSTQVTLVCQEELPDWRRAIGWKQPGFGMAELVTSPDSQTFQALLRNSGPDTVHIFSGTRGNSLVWQAFQGALETEAQVGVYAEAHDWRGVKGMARLVRAYVDALRFRSQIDFILAIGHTGVRWFKSCGYPDAKIYPFGYFVEKPAHDPLAVLKSFDSRTAVHLAMIGQTVKRKGIDILLYALSGLKLLDWHLDIIGDGADRDAFQTLGENLGLLNRVDFLGSQQNEMAMHRLAKSDLLVLPSRWDGWGAVVNEALIRGIPVICTDRCGAATLIDRDHQRGRVVKAGSVAALRRALEAWIKRGPRTLATSTPIVEWSKRIQGKAAADYLADVVKVAKRKQQQKPIVPWLSAPGTQWKTELT